ncbi:hypothetical protein B9Z19DRAFT_1125373 [Tuber borchii]|uniref:Uncharacterized protein n=1 Tax=Tuber borchii TaxID=42251 RepID=A0A2T6ZV83_TUBBO|nr:hypothetical protein B9Z19DRAFT_1125373 [Tuber borchii]
MGHTIHKCDRVISGNLPKSGRRHWRQFRFTVTYEDLAFCLPLELYASLNVSSALSVSPETTTKLWERAVRLRTESKSDQGGWVSFVQDIAPYILAENLDKKWESGDRIPEDLTIAPVQANAVRVVFLCVATGMKFSGHSPATGELSMSRKVGTITTVTNESLEDIRMLSWVVNQGNGMWANAVFGKVNDRVVGRGFPDFTMFLKVMEGFLLSHGWLEGSRTDSIGGAAEFMAVATMDVNVAISPTCIHAWCAHFVEVIVKAHLYEIQGTEPVINTPGFCHVQGNIIDSRRLIATHPLGSAPPYQPDPETLNTIIEPLQPFSLANHGLLSSGTCTEETEHPSAFLTPAADMSY